MKIVFLTALAGALAVVAPAANAAPPTLKGTVGPGFTITLTKGGTKIAKLKAGTYKVVVADRAGIHNFHLRGPGVNKSTSVAFKGTMTWTLKLRAGKYTYVCDPHASGMKGSFRVT
jgi:plastocyanin